jgi:hypothetical protein
LPSQLKPKELTKRLRAALWFVLHHYANEDASNYAFGEPWDRIFHALYVFRFGGATDEFDPAPRKQNQFLKAIILSGRYEQVYDLLQWILRHKLCPRSFQETSARS